jgi:hypothetical protein
VTGSLLIFRFGPAEAKDRAEPEAKG